MVLECSPFQPFKFVKRSWNMVKDTITHQYTVIVRTYFLRKVMRFIQPKNIATAPTSRMDPDLQSQNPITYTTVEIKLVS